MDDFWTENTTIFIDLCVYVYVCNMLQSIYNISKYRFVMRFYICLPLLDLNN